MRDPVAVTIYKCTFLGFAICSPKYPVHYHMLLLVAGWNSAHPQMIQKIMFILKTAAALSK